MSNKKLLYTTFETLLKEVNPKKLIENNCRFEGDTLYIGDDSIEVPQEKKITLLGSGKAVIPMAKAMHGILGDKIGRSLIIGPYEMERGSIKTDYIKSSHPLPSGKSIASATALKESLQQLEDDDIFIYLLSGGSSALVEMPEEGITLEEFQKATELMIKSHMPIEAINCVRKHISQVKGGKLGLNTNAKGIVLVLSDVLGDDLHAIGSAPLYFDHTTFGDALDHLRAHSLFERMPSSIQRFLLQGSKGDIWETPKSAHENITHYIVGSNAIVLKKAKSLLEQRGIKATISGKVIQGDVMDVAKELAEFIRNYKGEEQCFIFGGEATVNVEGEGKGGRNQHLALSVLQQLDGTVDMTFLSAATDGIDGNSDAAGALIDTHSLLHTKRFDIDWKHYLETFDSNTFFERTQELLMPGPTHNNLLDIVMVLIETNLKQGTDNV